MKAPRHPGGTLRLAPRPQNQTPPAPLAPLKAAPSPVQREAGKGVMRHPGGTLRLAERPRDDAAPAPPPSIPPKAVPAVVPPAQPDPAAAVAQQKVPPKCEPETREVAAARRRQQTRETLALLRARWPEAFAAPVPLALGIIKEIRAGLGDTHVPALQLGRALHFWTSGPSYLARWQHTCEFLL